MQYSLGRSIAAEVRAELARQGRKQTELGPVIEVSAQGISRRLAGDQTISLDELHAIAGFLGVPISEFMARATAPLLSPTETASTA